MNWIRGVNTRRLIITAAVLVVLSTVILIWARDIIRETIVLPISYLIYVAGVLIDTTPQICFWLGLVVLSTWIAYRSLRAKRRAPTQAATPAMYEMMYDTAVPQPMSGRMQYWGMKVETMRRGTSSYYQSSFETAVGRLLLDTLAYRYRLPTVDVENRLRDGSLDVPEDVRQYVMANLHSTPIRQRSFFAWLRDMLVDMLLTWRDRLRKRWRLGQPGRTNTPAEQRVQRILTYIEEELEVPHGDPLQ